jgi:hypothetical protein
LSARCNIPNCAPFLCRVMMSAQLFTTIRDG